MSRVRDRFDVEIRKAEIIEDGAAALVTLRVVVPEGANVLEALVTLSQDEAQGTAGFSPPTDGDRATITVRVPILDGQLERDPAQISAFILLLNDDGTTRQAQDSEERTLRGPRVRERDEAPISPALFDDGLDGPGQDLTAQAARLEDLRASADWQMASG